jgi:hypothetical protein
LVGYCQGLAFLVGPLLMNVSVFFLLPYMSWSLILYFTVNVRPLF